jgi:hypothetical protein
LFGGVNSKKTEDEDLHQIVFKTYPGATRKQDRTLSKLGFSIHHT